jgi:hypothetical protein
MVEAYARRRDLAKLDIRYLFRPGDQVLLRNREVGKLKARSVGPYVFLKYIGKLKTVGLISMGGDKVQQVSAANLVPVDKQLAERRCIAAQQLPPPPGTNSTSSITDSSSTSAGTVPRGTVVLPELGTIDPNPPGMKPWRDLARRGRGLR